MLGSSETAIVMCSPVRSNWYVWSNQFLNFAIKLPCDLDVITIHAPIPGLRFLAQSLKVGNSSLSQALPREDPDFDLRLIEPAAVCRRVMNGEAVPDFGGHFGS